MTTHVWYHANCDDGFAAAWAISKKVAEGPKYTAVHYGQKLPKWNPGDQIWFVDFSPTRGDLHALLWSDCRVLIIDHHKTAMETLEGCKHENLEMYFDMDRSGAMMAWNFFHPRDLAPTLIEYVQDRDLWRFSLDRSKDITAYIRSFPRDRKEWDKIDQELRHPNSVRFLCAADEGKAILRYQERVIERHVERCYAVRIAGLTTLVVNATTLYSEIAGRLSELCSSGVGACYFRREDGRWQYSLRSSGRDVSKLAEVYGGGGHHSAAGFVVDELL